MGIDTTFKPLGPTQLVSSGTSLQLVPKDAALGVNSFRVKNVYTSRAYFNWGPASSVPVPTAPAAGVPAPSTIGVEPAGVVYIDVPPSYFFNCSALASFEVTPGAGGTGG